MAWLLVCIGLWLGEMVRREEVKPPRYRKCRGSRRLKPGGFQLQTRTISYTYTFATGSLPSSGSGAAHEQEWLPCPLVYLSTCGSGTMIPGG